MKKKIFFSIALFLAVFVAVGIVKIKAGNFALMHGWGWGGSSDSNGNPTGLGWISLNSSNPGAGGANYGVSVPSANCVGAACQTTGYAWGGNNDNGKGGPVGWIDFDSADNCTTGTPGTDQYKAASCAAPDGSTGSVLRTTTGLTGWARFVSIAKETVNNNTGGFDGWISLVPDPAHNLGVTIDQSGKLSGYAYSDEYGWLDMSAVTVDVAPTIDLQASPNQINLAAGQASTTTLQWKSTNNVGVSSCTATCSDNNGNALNCSGLGTSNWNGATSGNISTTVPANYDSVWYHITCTGSGPGALVSQEAKANVTVGCEVKTCEAGGTGKCNYNSSTFQQMATLNPDLCKDTCSGPDDCAIRQTGQWKEVTP